MSEAKLNLECPYCSETFGTAFPVMAEEKGYETPIQTGTEPDELHCVPYTRDVGKFDPDTEDKWFDEDGWTRIGTDFMRFLNWDHLVGILRIKESGVNIQYRVQGCPKCKAFFDVYANYTPGLELERYWPHLFGANPDNQQAIKLYEGESWPIWLVRKIGGQIKSNAVGALLVGLLVFCISALPSVFSRYKQHVYLVEKFSRQLRFFSYEYYQQGFQLQSSFPIWGKYVIIYSIAILAVVIVLIIEEHFLNYLSTTHDTDDLLVVADKHRGIVHWKNYTLSRYVGVQTAEGDQGKKLPRPTQSDIMAGGIAQGTMLLIWLGANGRFVKPIAGLLGIVMFFILCFVIYKFRQNIRMPQNKIAYRAVIFLWVVFLGITILGVYTWVNLSTYWRITQLYYLFDLLFWVIAGYVLGVAVWFSLSLVHYVLPGISRIPMDLSPFDNFANAGFLRKLQSYATQLALVLFVTVVVVVTILKTGLQMNWLLWWMQLVLAVLFTGVGLGLGKGEYFGIAILYGAVLGVSYLMNVQFPAPLGKYLDLQVIILGIFFTALIVFQVLSADRTITDLFASAKAKTIQFFEDQINTLCAQIELINQRIQSLDEVSDSAKITELISQRRDILNSTDSIVGLIEKTNRVAVRPNLLRRLPELTAPLITSIVFPLIQGIILDEVSKQLKNLILN